jgi:hypothetical protein
MENRENFMLFLFKPGWKEQRSAREGVLCDCHTFRKGGLSFAGSYGSGAMSCCRGDELKNSLEPTVNDGTRSTTDGYADRDRLLPRYRAVHPDVRRPGRESIRNGILVEG